EVGRIGIAIRIGESSALSTGMRLRSALLHLAAGGVSRWWCPLGCLDLVSKGAGMKTNIATPWCRVMGIALVCSTVSVANLRADPVTVTSGHLQTGRGPAYEAWFTFSGTDGFFLDAVGVPTNFVTASCAPSGCRTGDVFNLSAVAGAGSGVTSTRLPGAFTLGTAFAATVNGTEFARGSGESFPGPLG